MNNAVYISIKRLYFIRKKSIIEISQRVGVSIDEIKKIINYGKTNIK